MSHDIGKQAESEFLNYWKTWGKRAVVHRFIDARDLYGLNSRAVQSYGQPADFLVGVEGKNVLVEVKGTENATGFGVSGIQKSQRAAATMSVAAKAPYWFALRAFHLNTNCWFVVPADVMLKLKGRVPWASLTEWKKEVPCFPM